MQTECSADLFGFARVEGRAVVAGFDGGRMTSDAGAMLLGLSSDVSEIALHRPTQNIARTGNGRLGG